MNRSTKGGGSAVAACHDPCRAPPLSRGSDHSRPGREASHCGSWRGSLTVRMFSRGVACWQAPSAPWTPQNAPARNSGRLRPCRKRDHIGIRIEDAFDAWWRSSASRTHGRTI